MRFEFARCATGKWPWRLGFLIAYDIVLTLLHQDTAAHMFNVESGMRSEPAQGLAAFQSWLSLLYGRSLAKRSPRGIIEVDEAVSRRFCLGIGRTSAFVALPDPEFVWAAKFRWSHAAIYRGREALHLVTEGFEFDGNPVAPFALALVCTSHVDPSRLEGCETIELKKLLEMRGAAQAMVAHRSYATMPLYLLDHDESVFAVAHPAAESKRSTMGV
jgi:hypothetical protein